MKKILVLLAIGAAFVAFRLLGGEQYLLPETYQALYAARPLATALIFFTVYIVVTALSIPGAAVMTMIAGAIFGLWTGVLIVSFASTIGATLAFLSSRLLLRDWVQAKFSRYLKRVNDGIRKDGAWYLFSLRLIPAIPFFAINLAMGLTTIRLPVFYVVSQIGMLPGTLVYVNAGAQIGKIDELSPAGILKPEIIGAFILLAAFPFIVKGIWAVIRRASVYRPWRAHKPPSFDRNLIVIGAGSAGLVTAYIAAAVRARVTLIEKADMGGDCLNTGCVPSKALIRSAKIKRHIDESGDFGVASRGSAVDFAAVMARVHRVIGAIEPHDSVERYESLGVDVIKGEAEVLSPWSVRVDGRTLTSRNLVLATGAEPLVPAIPGIDKVETLTSDTLWGITELPARLLVVGAGPIGCELAQAFRRLGAAVTLTDMAERLLPREDADVARHIEQIFAEEGIAVLTGHKTVGFRNENGRQQAVLETGDGEKTVEFDRVLIAVGRKPRTRGHGFDALGLELRSDGSLEVNEFLQTKYPNVYACGDVTGPFQFTHVAAHQAWYAGVNALFSPLKKFRADYRVIPWATFTDPEVAHVGLSEADAIGEDTDYEITKYSLAGLDRAIADGEASGFVKVLTPPGKDRILGVTIVGYQASNLLAEYVLAMKQNIGLNRILGTIHVYPTMAEANKYAAGEWKRANAPQRLLEWVARFHRWRLH